MADVERHKETTASVPRAALFERAQVYEILNRIGAMSVEEIRAEEDMLL